jgi:hypothetical protein
MNNPKVFHASEVNEIWNRMRERAYNEGPNMVVDVLIAAGFDIDFDGPLDPSPSQELRAKTQEKREAITRELDETPCYRVARRAKLKGDLRWII